MLKSRNIQIIKFFRSNFLNYLNHPFLLEEIIFSFSAFVLLLAFLKAKLASITVTIDIKKDQKSQLFVHFEKVLNLLEKKNLKRTMQY